MPSWQGGGHLCLSIFVTGTVEGTKIRNADIVLQVQVCRVFSVMGNGFHPNFPS